jgi:hypothetical protein
VNGIGNEYETREGRKRRRGRVTEDERRGNSFNVKEREKVVRRTTRMDEQLKWYRKSKREGEGKGIGEQRNNFSPNTRI